MKSASEAEERKESSAEQTRDEYYTIGEICNFLGTTVDEVRRVLEDFDDHLNLTTVDGLKVIPKADLSTLRDIFEKKEQGYQNAEILRLMALELDAADADQQVELLKDITRQLKRTEKRLGELENRVIDQRDRLMVTLLKVQKELNQLRYDIGTLKSRRDRREETSLLKRLLGL